jgi:uncharacterized protein YndB with AHSA1/START domain
MAIDFSFDVDIARPPEQVFAFLSDLRRLPEWQPLVVEAEQLGEGPLRQGSRVREARNMRGKRLEQIVEIATFEPPRRFAVKVVEGPLPLHGDLTLSPTSDGSTRLHMHAHGHARGAMRMAEPVLKLGIKREFRKQYRRLKELVEAGPAQAS